VLGFALQREAEDIARRASASATGRAAETLLKEGPLRLTLIGLKDGAVIEEHVAPGPITIQALKGSLQVTAGDNTVAVPAGNLVAIEANLRHSVRSNGESALLLTLHMPENASEFEPPVAHTDSSSTID